MLDYRSPARTPSGLRKFAANGNREARLTMQPEEIKEGETYRTSVAVWTVTQIRPSGMVSVRRDDGRTAQFGLPSFAEWVVERVPHDGEPNKFVARSHEESHDRIS